LGQSFKIVSDRLEQVHKGLGEMQTLATGVGDLKKVLTNVKTRGVIGEYQLENILEQMMTPEQYAKNVKTKAGSNAMVEFAIKLPGKKEDQQIVWLPLDAKFPTEDYQVLLSAYDNSDAERIETTRKQLASRIRLFAKEIQTKYIDPPHTTDFGIMFLPFEGLYAEVLRLGLFEAIQREYKIVISGPTTLAAFLNSLQMGFRTLAIEKRSSEVWEILGAVKTEFGKFGTILEKTQKKLRETSNVIEQAGVRTRAIERKLRDVQELPLKETELLLNEPEDA
jgi:DNA recombination protein RmuC